MDYKGLKAIPNMERSEVIIMLIVLVLSVVWNLVYAVGVGMVIAALIFMKKMSDITANESEIKKLKDETETGEYWSDEIALPDDFNEEVYIKHLNGPLFFGFTNDFQDLINQIPSTASHVIIRMGRVPYIDQSGLFAMEDALIDMRNKNITPVFVGLKEQPDFLLRRIGIIPDLVSEELTFKDFNSCAGWIKENVDAGKFTSSGMDYEKLV